MNNLIAEFLDLKHCFWDSRNWIGKTLSVFAWPGWCVMLLGLSVIELFKFVEKLTRKKL